VDQSEVGLAKARALAAEQRVTIRTEAARLEQFVIAPGAWAGIISIFVHHLPAVRRPLHRAVVAGLKPGGAFVLEAYAPAQIGMGTGGPREPERLAGLADLTAELDGLEWRIGREGEREVVEGRYHHGRAVTVQLLGVRQA
jgi:hypothetical protein